MGRGEASQARHQSVAHKRTFASRIVVSGANAWALGVGVGLASAGRIEDGRDEYFGWVWVLGSRESNRTHRADRGNRTYILGITGKQSDDWRREGVAALAQGGWHNCAGEEARAGKFGLDIFPGIV